MNLIKSIFFAAIISAALSFTVLGQASGSIAGTVADVNGAIVQGATVTAVGPDGKEKTATTNKNGEFAITNLAPANYIVRVIAVNFALFENPEVAVTAGKKSELTVSLAIQAVTETVDVGSPDQVSTDPNNNAGATVLSEKELEALPVAGRGAFGFAGYTGRWRNTKDLDCFMLPRDRDAAVALFRIAQEALNNVAKHASAKHVGIALSAAEGQMIVEISDDGAGFDPLAAEARASRWGMTTMRERAEAAGGRLDIASTPGSGTVLRARVPF